jgi:3-hydroxybenzoate 6-monooxygenase
MPKDLQHPYPTFWAGPGWHVIYYPISDWSMFNLGCTVVTGQSMLIAPEDFGLEAVLPYFTDPCEIPARVLRIPKRFRRFVIVHREPVGN